MPAGARQETSRMVSWVKTIGTGRDYGFLRSYPAPVIVAWWECRLRVV